MKHLGTITEIHGGKIAPVDIITFGSPCQDLSVASKREGLDGGRSNLFYEAVRIVYEMQEATCGVYPRIAVWENVPGAFSSNKGRDFRAVLEALTETEIPMPPSGKWADAGMVRGNGREVAWRCLDAQHWGVPQRRKRIFLVADFAGQCAGEILFEREGLSGDFTEGREAREEAAATVGGGIEKSIGAVDCRNACEKEELSATIQSSSAKGGYSLNKINPVRIGYAVRRLTPLECERLQGFPDGWTEGESDTARYKMLGNSLAVPCVEWIMRQIVAKLKLKTMGSLFDGIAGFPLGGKRAGIKTLWASEIEPACIRVSTKHFPGG